MNNIAMQLELDSNTFNIFELNLTNGLKYNPQVMEYLKFEMNHEYIRKKFHEFHLRTSFGQEHEKIVFLKTLLSF
jgi:hypothetical protein